MPYFYRLSDYLENQHNWFKTVILTKNIIKNSCKKKYKNSNVRIIILALDPTSLKPKTIKNYPNLNKFFKYEYFTENGISNNCILYILTFEEFATNLQNLIIENRAKNYYIHITCADNINSILQRGLLSETELNTYKLRTVNI